MRLQRTVVTDKPLGKVFDYLSDFTSTTDWDPGTVTTIRLDGDGGVGTSYLNTSEFLGRRTELRYVVQEFVPGERVRLRGENKTVISVDTMAFRPAAAGTEVTYTAEFAFKGAARYLAPLFRPALTRLGNQAVAGLCRALGRLALREGRSPLGPGLVARRAPRHRSPRTGSAGRPRHAP